MSTGLDDKIKYYHGGERNENLHKENENHGYIVRKKQASGDNNQRRWNRTSETVPIHWMHHNRRWTMQSESKNKNCNGKKSVQWRENTTSLRGKLHPSLKKKFMRILVLCVALYCACSDMGIEERWTLWD